MALIDSIAYRRQKSDRYDCIFKIISDFIAQINSCTYLFSYYLWSRFIFVTIFFLSHYENERRTESGMEVGARLSTYLLYCCIFVTHPAPPDKTLRGNDCLKLDISLAE